MSPGGSTIGAMATLPPVHAGSSPTGPTVTAVAAAQASTHTAGSGVCSASHSGGRGTQDAMNLLAGNEGVELVAMADLFEDHLEDRRKQLVEHNDPNISSKVKSGQTDRIVLNLNDSPLGLSDVQGVLSRKPVSGLQEVIGIKDGTLTHIFP